VLNYEAREGAHQLSLEMMHVRLQILIILSANGPKTRAWEDFEP
jgi:hypothetical protein